MALPKKKSRTLTVDETHYRWLVSMNHGVLHLTVEAAESAGQILQAFFEPHNQFKRRHDGRWLFHRQGRSIAPNHVARIIRHGLANGWQPFARGRKPMQIHTWNADKVAPAPIKVADNEVPVRELAIDQVRDLRFDVSLDPYWRKILFDAPTFKRYMLPN